jgi:rhomboid protease GluP
MLNEPPENNRRPHPLELKPKAPPPPSSEQGEQGTMHIPSVPPNLTRFLIAINVFIFVVFGLFLPDIYADLVAQGANQQQRVLRGAEYHRLFTAMFLHGGLAHLFFNMYALYIIGSRVEMLFGHLRFTLIYFLGGLAGSILSVVFSSPFSSSVGASGAVFAIFGAEMIFLYQHRKLLGEGGKREFKSMLWIAGLNFAIGIFSSLSDSPVRIDNWGHVGGLVGGLILTWFIAPLFLLKRHPERELSFIAYDVNPLKDRYQAISLYIAGLLFILIIARQFLT